MDFDIDLAKENTKDNPVYYVQYAYARCHNLMKKSRVILIQVLVIILTYLIWSKSFQF